MTRTWRWLEGGPLLATRRRTEDEIEGEGGEDDLRGRSASPP